MYSSHSRPAVNREDNAPEQSNGEYMSIPPRVGSITTQVVYQLSEMFEGVLDSVVNEYMKAGITDVPEVAVESFEQAFRLALLSFQSKPMKPSKIGFQAPNRETRETKTTKTTKLSKHLL